MQNAAGDDIAAQPDDGPEAYRSIVSELVSLAGQVQSSLKLIEQAIARQASLVNQDAFASIFVLDDVTPCYVKASVALKACDAGLGVALDLLLDSRSARSLN